MAPVMSISMISVAAAAEINDTIMSATAKRTATGAKSSKRTMELALILTTSIAGSLLLGFLGYFFLRIFQRKRRAGEQERREVMEARQMKDTDHTLSSRYSMIDLEAARSSPLRQSPTPERKSSVAFSTMQQSNVPGSKNSIEFSPHFHPGIKRSRSVGVPESRREVSGLSPPVPTYTRKMSEPTLRSYTASPESFKTFGFDTYQAPPSEISTRGTEAIRHAYNPPSPSTSLFAKSTRNFKNLHAELSPQVSLSLKTFRFPFPAVETTTESGKPIQRPRSDSKISSAAASMLPSRAINKYTPPTFPKDKVEEGDDEKEEEQQVTPLEHLSKDMTEEEHVHRLETWLDGAPLGMTPEEEEDFSRMCPFQKAKILEARRNILRIQSVTRVS